MQRTKFDRQMDITRESGIELLKILAIFLIIVSHIVQTLRSENLYLSYQDYVLDLSAATTDIQHFILILFSYFGALGDTIFFVCSAWFLLRSSKCNKRKWFYILFEVWIISIIILVISYIMMHGNIPVVLIVKSVLPTTFANNWYLTCYLLFYPIHPILNKLINCLDKTTLFRLSSAMFVLYCCFAFIKTDVFFVSPIILWITVYFVTAYIQLYMGNFAGSLKKNIVLLILGIVGFVGFAAVVDILGLHIPFLKERMLYWVSIKNPFLLAVTIALFNMVRKIHFKSALINYISGLAMLIYIIHENIILRTYFRPYMVIYVYKTYGYNNIIFWVLVMAAFVFLFSVLCSIVYDKTLRRLVKAISDFLYSVLKKIYLRAECNALKCD